MGLKIHYLDAKIYRHLVFTNAIVNNDLYFIVDNYKRDIDTSRLLNREYFLSVVNGTKVEEGGDDNGGSGGIIFSWIKN